MEYLWQFYFLIGLVTLQGLLLVSGNNKSGKRLFLWLCFIELVFIAGFRAWNIGADTPNYVGEFISAIAGRDWSGSHMESGYVLYTQFLALFTSNPQAILIANAFVITGAILQTIRKYSPVVLLPVLLFVILDYATTLNILRQYMALAIVLLSFPFVVKRQFVFFAISCLIATTFHTSAILAIGLYFIYPLKFKFKNLWWIMLATMVCFILLAPIADKIISLTGRYASYQGNILLGEETKVASVIKTFVQLSIAGFCVFSYKFLYKEEMHKTKIGLPVSFLLWCSVISVCLQFISIRGIVMERLVIYFSTLNFLSVPFFVHCYPKKSRWLVVIILLACFIAYRSIIFVYRPDWNPVLPFEFCF